MKMNKFFSSKIKLILATILLTFLGGLTLMQANSVNANVSTLGGGPITGPITSPLPTPTPVPNPISYFLIKGKVTLQIGKVKNPAVGAIVEALNMDTQEVSQGTTDAEGQYRISVKNGNYKVSPVSECVRTQGGPLACVLTNAGWATWLFTPEYRKVYVDGQNESGVSFKGELSVTNP